MLTEVICGDVPVSNAPILRVVFVMLRTFPLLIKELWKAPLMLVKTNDDKVKLPSTMLLMNSGSKFAKPPPGVRRAEVVCVSSLLKMTFSPGFGAPGTCQFCASDQFVFKFGRSAPLQLT